MFYFPFFDVTYLWFVIIPLLISMWASARVNSTFQKFSQVTNGRGLTAAQVTRMILDRNADTVASSAAELSRSGTTRDVRVEQVSGRLTDHFDPRTNTIRLSEGVFGSASVAAIGVAAHEAGHAAQYAQGYFPIKLRNVLAPVASIASYAALPIVLLGFLFEMFGLVDIGIILYSAVVLFSLITLPVEFNASRRALSTLDSYGILSPEENAAAKKVLSAAAMTYVASTLAAIGSLLRLIAIFGGRRHD